MRRTVIVGLLVAIGAAAGAWWWFTRAEQRPQAAGAVWER